MIRLLRILVGSAVVAVFFVVVAWTMNLALYHWWAASVPPTLSADWHRQWGNRFFLGSITTLAGLVCATSIYVHWLDTKKLQYRLRTLLLLPLIVAILGALWRVAAPPLLCIAVLAVTGAATFMLARQKER